MSHSIGFFFRFVRVLVVLAVAVAIALLLFRMKEKPDKKEIEPRIPSVTVVPVSPVTKVMMVDVFGTVKPRNSVRIAAEVSGRIDRIHSSFIDGGFIRKDELLVQIDDAAYELDRQSSLVRIRQARTDLQRLDLEIANLKKDRLLAQENLALADSELNRTKALNAQQFTSVNTVEKVKQQHLSARSRLQAIENQLALSGTLKEQKQAALAMAAVDHERAELALSKTGIIAPFDGYVLEKHVQTGEVINAGQLLGIMYEKGKLDVDVSIPMENLRWFAAEFETGAGPEALVQMNHPAKEGNIVWKARVARVMAQVDATTRTLPMTLEIQMDEAQADPVFALKPGFFVRCRIMGQSYDNITVIPRHLLQAEDMLYVYDQGRLKMADVNIIRKFEDDVYIDGGLNPGDRIVTSPLPGAVEGMALRVKDNGNE